MLSHPHFERSISLNDLDSAVLVREHVQNDIVTPEDDQKPCHLRTCSVYTFVLESFEELMVDYKKFLYSYLIDFMVFRDLEECRRLNWCEGVYPMVPVLTMGDGNCLMHAASIGMWAVSDRYHTLRKLVYSALIEDMERFYHKRWQREHEINNLSSHGYEMTVDQWTKEWQIVLDLVSQDEYPQGNNGLQFNSLEEIHVFVLANVLRRTIIVISDDVQKGAYDEPLSPLHYPGVYLPLKWDPIDCVKTPLVIGYTGGHFSAIVSFEDGVFDRGEAHDGVDDDDKIHGVPLQDFNGRLLPVHFLFKDEAELKDGLLRQYLDCTKIKHRNLRDNTEVVTLAAKLQFAKPPPCIEILMESFFTSALDTYNLMLQQKNERQSIQTPSLKLEHCKTEGCDFFGTWETLNYCSTCLEKFLKKETVSEEASGREDDRVIKNEHQQLQLQCEQQQQQQQGQQQQHHQQQIQGQLPQVQSKPLYKLQQERQLERQQQQQQQQNEQFEQQQLQQLEQQQLEQWQHQQLNQQQHVQNMQQQQQQQQQNQEQLQVLPQPQSSQLIQRICTSHGCRNVAEPKHGDLCSRCYETIVLAARQGSMTFTGNKDSALCANNGCEYHGIPQQEGFCSDCYKKFCKEMEARRNEEANQAVTLMNREQTPQQNVCQTPECTNTGFPDLYNRCVECYHHCIKQFIQASESESSATIAPASNPPQATTPPRLCSTAGCQNEGMPQLNGRCLDCDQIQPLVNEQPSNIPNNPTLERPHQEPPLQRQPQTIRPTPMMSITEPLGLYNKPALPTAQGPSLNRLYCETPKCGRPLGDTSNLICTECIMKKFQMKRKISPQQQQPILPNQEEQAKRSERSKEIQRAREQLPALYIPPKGQPPPPVKANTQGPVNTPGNANIQGHPSVQSRVGTGAETPLSGTKCLTNNCQFYASPTTQFLCSNCHDQEKREWDRIYQMTQRQRPALRNCALTNCYNWESPGNDGLCDKCYQIALRNEKVWDNALRRQRQSDPQRQQPIHTPPTPVRPPSPPPAQNRPRKAGNFVGALIPCKSAGCARFGTAENNGLCDPCFTKKQRHQALQTSSPANAAAASANIDRERLGHRQQAAGASSQTNAAAPANIDRERLNPRPQFLGTSLSTSTAAPAIVGRERPNTFQRTLIGNEPVSAVEPPRRVFGGGSGPLAYRCIQDGCSMTGSAELSGYCSKCFEDYTRLHAYPQHAPDLTMNQQAPQATGEPVRTGLTTLPSPTPRTCRTLNCNNQVQKDTMNHCRECLIKLYPQYARSNNMI